MQKKKFIKVRRGKGPATEVYHLKKNRLDPTRYRFHGIVYHKGKMMRQRLGFYGAKKIVEIAYIPLNRRR